MGLVYRGVFVCSQNEAQLISHSEEGRQGSQKKVQEEGWSE